MQISTMELKNNVINYIDKKITNYVTNKNEINKKARE